MISVEVVWMQARCELLPVNVRWHSIVFRVSRKKPPIYSVADDSQCGRETKGVGALPSLWNLAYAMLRDPC